MFDKESLTMTERTMLNGILDRMTKGEQPANALKHSAAFMMKMNPGQDAEIIKAMEMLGSVMSTMDHSTLYIIAGAKKGRQF